MKTLAEGTRVRDIDGNEGVIVDVLSVQYFVKLDNGDDEWYFFKDKELKEIVNDN